MNLKVLVKDSAYKRFSFSFSKIVLMMQLTAFFMLVACLQVSATAYSQKVTIVGKDIPLKKVFKDIRKQTDYNFIYSNKTISDAHPVSLEVKNGDVQEVLKQVFHNQPLTYDIDDKIIIVKRKLFPSLMSMDDLQKLFDKEVTGVVRDSATGEPIVGATIKVKGKTKGTVTGADGKFSLEVEDNAVLEVSYLGYGTKLIPVLGKESLTISLSEAATGLNQLVVVGYGTQKRGNITGSISTVSDDAFNERPNTQLGYAIEGMMPGVRVLRSSGEPQSGFAIRIRGTSSITSSSEPLYIVDGVPTKQTNEISPGDIKSITVLKDAASAAIYGASGANGVILITTKQGGDYKTKVNLNIYDGFSTVWKKLNVLNSNQYRSLMNEMGESLIWSNYKDNTNWQNELFRTADMQNYELSIKGGDEKTKFYISGAWMKHEGVVIKNSVKRANFRLNFNHHINSFLKVGTNISFDRWFDAEVSQSSRNGTIMNAILGSPIIGIWDANGKSYTTDPFKQDIDNPVALAVGSHPKWTNFRFKGNVHAKIIFSKNLNFKTKFGVEEYHGVYHSFNDPNETVDGRTSNGSAERSSSDDEYWISQNTLNFHKRVNENYFTALVGFVVSKDVSSGSDISRHNFANAVIHTIGGGAIIDGADGSISELSKAAFLSRLTYDYNDRYLATVNFRADGASVFGPKKRWGYFPSFSLGWRLSKEAFFDNISSINDLKIRASWGQVGNANIDPYSYLGTVSSSPGYVFNGKIVGGLEPSSLSNFDLRWEATEQIDIGIDLSLFNSMISFTADYYNKETKNLLLNTPLPGSSGYSSAIKNIGSLRNRGVEFSLFTHNLNGTFKWNSSLNLSINHNKVLNIAGGTIKAGDIDQRGNSVIVRHSLPLGSFWGYIAKGVDTKTGNIVYKMDDPMNGLTTDDKTIIGNANPKFTYGFSNEFKYKQWAFTVFIQGVQGNEILNATRIYTEGMWEPRNQLTTVLNRWKKPGQHTNMPREDLTNTSSPQPNYNSLISSRFIEDGSYLRLKSVRLSYSFSHKLIKKIKLSQLKIYIDAENLLTLTNYSGFDPEVSAFGASNVAPGIDFGTYPQTRNVILGIRLSF